MKARSAQTNALGIENEGLEHLPIVPRQWQLTPAAPDLLKTIKSLLPRATRVIHAGDPDREGQLLVDEVPGFLGYRGDVETVPISDLNPPAVRKTISTAIGRALIQTFPEVATKPDMTALWATAMRSCARYLDCRQTVREEEARPELPKRVGSSQRQGPERRNRPRIRSAAKVQGTG